MLGGHAANGWTGKYELSVGLVVRIDAGHLICLGVEDLFDGVFDVVAVISEILRQPIEQVGVPRGLFHIVRGFD